MTHGAVADLLVDTDVFIDHRSTRRVPSSAPGGVRERPNRHAWKACVGQPTVGSNPTPSATCPSTFMYWSGQTATVLVNTTEVMLAVDGY